MVTADVEDGAGQHQPNQQQLVRRMEPKRTEPQQHNVLPFPGEILAGEYASGFSGVMGFGT